MQEIIEDDVFMSNDSSISKYELKDIQNNTKTVTKITLDKNNHVHIKENVPTGKWEYRKYTFKEIISEWKFYFKFMYKGFRSAFKKLNLFYSQQPQYRQNLNL